MTPDIFSYRFRVPASAIDAMQHVNNVTSLQWCLDAAEAHWISKASETIRKKYAWVVLDHFISYKAPAFEGDELEIETWIATYEGVKSQRNYKITRLHDKRTIVEARTTWCLLDGKTHKPLKISEEIRTLFH